MLIKDRILEYIDSLPFAEIRAAWIARCRAESDRMDKFEASLVADGFERVRCEGFVTEDGREILRVRGRAYALRQDVHAERLTRRLADKKAKKSPEVKESISAATCPQMIEGKPCGGALNRKGVCPSCVTGKMGYKYRYTCESCGCDIVTREELR